MRETNCAYEILELRQVRDIYHRYWKKRRYYYMYFLQFLPLHRETK